MTSSSSPRPGKVLAIDLGSVRIGLAISDTRRSVALPLGVLQRSASRVRDHEQLARVVKDHEVVEVLVGLPVALSGDHGPAARAARVEIDELRRRLEVPVLARDERLTTVVATRMRRELGPPPRRSTRRSSRRDVAPVDDGAAAVLLQSYLDEAR